MILTSYVRLLLSGTLILLTVLGTVRVFRREPFAGYADSNDSPLPSQGSIDAGGRHVDPDVAGLHIVIAHYDEEPLFIRRWTDNVRAMTQVQGWGAHTFLYSKGANVTRDELQQVTAADTVELLPNVGREGSTYLHHILENWDRLAEYTLFSQAILHRGQREGSGADAGMLRTWLDERLREHLNEKTGFMSLNPKNDLCYCGHCTDMGGRDFYPQWPQIYALLHGKVCAADTPNVVSFHAAFVVSRRRIQARGRRFYEQMQELITAPAEHWLHFDGVAPWFKKQKGPSRPSNPWFGHQLERLWHEIFDCGRLEHVVHCRPNLVTAQGEGGCSCLDP